MSKLIDSGKKTIEKKFNDLGYMPDLQKESDFSKGIFKNKERKLNIVALGDSVSAGYTTLIYKTGSSSPRDVLSFADSLVEILAKKSRLGTYYNLARDGATTSDLLNTVYYKTNVDILKSADVITLTIGANDILKAINLLGSPYTFTSSMLSSTAFLLPQTGSSLSTSRTSAGYENPQINFDALANSTFKTLNDVYNGNLSSMFTVDDSNLNYFFKNAVSEILKAISWIHNLAPSAQIFFNEYVYPFNPLIYNEKNVTEIESDNFLKLGYDTKTLKETYTYAMKKLRTTLEDNFKCVKWFSMQASEDKIIEKLIKDKLVNTKNEAYLLLQKDISDIHTTEYAQSLIGQDFFNTEFSDLISEQQSLQTYDDVKDRVATATVSQGNEFYNLFLNNSSANNEKLFLSNLFKKVNSLAENSFARKSFFDFFTNFYKTLLICSVFRISSSAMASAKNDLIATAKNFVDNLIFDDNSSLYDFFVKDENISKNFNATTSSYNFYGILRDFLLESEISHTDTVYQNLGLQLWTITESQKTELLSKNVAIKNADLNDLASATSFAKNFFEKMTALPTDVSKWQGNFQSLVEPFFKNAANELNKTLVYASTLTNKYPGILKTKDALADRKLLWTDLRRNSKGVMDPIK